MSVLQKLRLLEVSDSIENAHPVYLGFLGNCLQFKNSNTNLYYMIHI